MPWCNRGSAGGGEVTHFMDILNAERSARDQRGAGLRLDNERLESSSQYQGAVRVDHPVLCRLQRNQHKAG